MLSAKEDELGDALVGVDLGGQGRGVGDFQRDLAAPLGLEGRDIDDQAATGVGALADADDQDVSGDFDGLDGFAEDKAVGGDDDMVAPGGCDIDLDHEVVAEALGVDDGDIAMEGGCGEDLEAGADAYIVPVAGNSIGDLARPLDGGLEGLDADAFTDLAVAQDGHAVVSRERPFSRPG